MEPLNVHYAAMFRNRGIWRRYVGGERLLRLYILKRRCPNFSWARARTHKRSLLRCLVNGHLHSYCPFRKQPWCCLLVNRSKLEGVVFHRTTARRAWLCASLLPRGQPSPTYTRGAFNERFPRKPIARINSVCSLVDCAPQSAVRVSSRTLLQRKVLARGKPG